MEDFVILYDRYVSKIYRFIYYRTMHRETAEDLTSHTFIKALEALQNFDITKGSFSAWLYRIARNNVIDYYRTNQQVDDIDSIYNLNNGVVVEVDHDIKETLQKVKKYLEKIKPEQREIVIMKLWGQLNYQEISIVTGKSVANCKMIFSRTMARLREDMAFILTSLLLIIVNIINI